MNTSSTRDWNEVDYFVYVDLAAYSYYITGCMLHTLLDTLIWDREKMNN
jgi:hypothetical protein